MADTKAKYIFYHYDPSLAAAVIFVILFFVTTLAHVHKLVMRRTWFFIPFVIGGFFEAIGYVGRAISSTQTPNWTKEPYICQSLLLLLAPALFAASIYMLLARIIRVTDAESHLLIKVKWLTSVFVLGDVLSFLAQSAGGGMLATAKDPNGVKRGENIITGGLFIQLFFFGFFVIVAGVFQHRISRYPTGRSKAIEVPWQRHLVVLYLASAFIVVRSVVRIAQYIQGSEGVLLQNEVFLYIFDGTLMFLTMVLYNVWHPSQIIAKHLLDKTLSDPESLNSSHRMPDRFTGGHIAAG
ncbi:hypothetical protein MMC30_004515 [Trapelia coarctata]|nr:hypothetical protein [Trapelia coarctata]